MSKRIECKDCKHMYDCGHTYLGGCTDGEEYAKEMLSAAEDKKYIKYIAQELPKEYVSECRPKSVMDMLAEAQKHAMAENIKANAIVINENFVKTPHLIVGDSVLPPMICGLECYFTDEELPKDYSFAILEKPITERERLVAETEQRLEDLFVEFDEMCFYPATTCPFPHHYASEWKGRLIYAIGQLCKEKVEKFAERLKELVAERNCNDDYDWEDVQVDGQIFIECVDEICKEITEG